MRIRRDFDEDELRELIEDAVRFARNTTPGNVSNEAVIQRAMKERFVDGNWRSMLFNEQYNTTKALKDVVELFEKSICVPPEKTRRA